MPSWKEMLDQLLGRRKPAQLTLPLHPREESPHGQLRLPLSSPGEPGIVEVNLGVDFGTRFTKLCWRDIARGESRILYVPPLADSAGFIESVLNISPDGSVSLSRPRSDGGEPGIQIDYLKMRLLGREQCGLPPSHPMVEELGHDGMQALAAFFLARVLLYARRQAAEELGRVYGDVQLGWSANVGVPVEYFTDAHIQTFRRVFAAAWEWSESIGEAPLLLTTLLDHYQSVLRGLDADRSDCHAQPEVVAGLHALVRGRRIRPGEYPYAFADVGAGTVDLVSFKLGGTDGQHRAEMLEGKVQPLGTCVIAERLPGAIGADQEPLLFTESGEASDIPPAAMQQLEQVRTLVAGVLGSAKSKRPDVFCRRRDRDGAREAEVVGGSLRDDIVRPVKVFLGGGGAVSPLYRDLIYSTYAKHRLRDTGLPPIEFGEVPCPDDIEAGSHALDFGRFCIAYGLSFPDQQFMQYKRPEETGPAFPRHKREGRGPKYEDTGDMM